MGCCCEYRAPRRLRYVPPAVVALIIAYLYGAFVWFAQPQLRARDVGWLELGAFHVMFVLLCASLGQCLLSNDSFVTRRKKDATPPPPPSDMEGEEPTAVETKANGARRFCRRCNVWKADRMHHCSTCKRCVLKMDHHCVYINKCIGYHNYKFFLQFLGWSSSTCLYFASLIFRYMLLDHLDYATALFFHGRLFFWSPSLQIAIVFFFGACLGAALLCFYLLHVALTAFNYTTLEYCEKRRDGDYINYFNLGILGNLQQVLGTFSELPYWFLPLATPSAVRRGGTVFPVNAKFAKTE